MLLLYIVVFYQILCIFLNNKRKNNNIEKDSGYIKKLHHITYIFHPIENNYDKIRQREIKL